MVHFQYGSIVVALFVRTIYLINRHIKCVLRTDEEEEEFEKEFEDVKKELDNQLWQFNIIFSGSRDWIEDVIDWTEEHSFLSTIIGYIFCLVPIVNLFLTLVDLQSIFKN